MTTDQLKPILFRADGDARIGLGHVMRCLALADMLGTAFDRHFALVQPAPELVRLIEEKGVTVVPLQTDDAAEFLDVVTPGSVVVLDGYAFDPTYQRAVRERAKRLVYIDDLTDVEQVADVVINHAGGVTEYDYQSEPYTQFLLGPRYALLRPPFFGAFGDTPREGPIFVSLGGADPHNVSLRVLDALRLTFREMGQSWRVHLVLGPFHPNRASIDAYRGQLKHLLILDNLTAEQMAAELKKCQLAITACSTVAYEVCAVGRPLIALQTADNQKRIADFLQNEMLAVQVAEVNDALGSYDLTIALVQSLQHSYMGRPVLARQRRYFDGRSPDRFRALFERLCS